jgi:predicted phage baseplate assembly protein
LNKPGDVVLHVPPSHRTAVFAGHRAGWLRCRFTRLHDEQSLYEESPLIHGAEAFTVGGTIGTAHQETVRDEVLGVSAGVPGQRFPLGRGPVLTGAVSVEVAGPDGWRAWEPTEDFDSSGERDRHFALDAVSRQVLFGPAIRQLDGTVRRLGAVPEVGAPIRATYRVGGGSQGNVRPRAIRTLRSQVPLVARVENRERASGGVDGEDVDAARQRAPGFLRTRDRAVTRADYEYLARAADPRVARVRAIGGRDDEPAVIRVVLLADSDADADEPLDLRDLRPSNELLSRVATDLETKRILGTRLSVTPPHFHWLSAEVAIRVPPTADAGRLERTALATVNRYLHPLQGGPQGSGWPFGRSVTSGELMWVLQRVLGVEAPETVHLFRVEPSTGERASGWTNKVEIGPGALPYGYQHTVVQA